MNPKRQLLLERPETVCDTSIKMSIDIVSRRPRVAERETRFRTDAVIPWRVHRAVGDADAGEQQAKVPISANLTSETGIQRAIAAPFHMMDNMPNLLTPRQ
jgi:hypothetical protein